MLKMIDCDLFIENGKKRPPINFKPGLNVIEGVETDEEYNSIGKTTLLMIIDFVFYGSDYLECIKKFPEEKRNHTIKFILFYGGEDHYFSRSTTDSDNIAVCDKNFNKIAELKKDEYKQLLKDIYNFHQSGITFRDPVQRFTRAAGCETLDTKYPIQSVNKEPMYKGITSLLKLFDEFEKLSAKKKEKDEMVKKDSTLDYNKRNGWMKIPSEKEYNAINKEQIELKKKLEDLLQVNEEGKKNIKSISAARLYELENQIVLYEDELRRLKSLINERTEYKSFSSSFKKDMKLMGHFFNEESVKTMEEVESFHIKLTASLTKEFEKDNEKIKNSIKLIEEQIKLLKDEVEKLKVPPSLPKQVVLDSGAIQVRLNEIERLINNYNRKKNIQDEKDRLISELSDYYNQLFTKLNTSINTTINEYNTKLTTKTSSIFTLIDETHYTFDNISDGSTGSGNRGVICFDLSMLKLTNLPYIIHDYDLIEPIETAVKNNIIKLYNEITNKQIFIVLKKENIYSPDVQNIINSNKRITLSSHGHELFGEAWNLAEQKK